MLMAIDPGGRHVGVALFQYRGDVRGWHVQAHEWTPNELAWFLARNSYDRVVCEEFRLYPGRAGAQSYSTMPTAELIGVIKYLCGQAGTELIMQPALIKKPTAAQLRNRGIAYVGTNDHMRDAELHGWHYIIKTDYKPGT